MDRSLGECGLNVDASEPLVSARELLLKAVSAASLIVALDRVFEAGSVTISDTGSGMSARDLVDNFLVIGTASRKREVEKALVRGDEKSRFSAKKGSVAYRQCDSASGSEWRQQQKRIRNSTS